MFRPSFQRPLCRRQNHNRLACLVVLCAIFASGNSHAQQALTLDRALRVAQERSRQLVAQEFAASASRDMAIAAGQLSDPTLKAGIKSARQDRIQREPSQAQLANKQPRGSERGGRSRCGARMGDGASLRVK